MRPRVQGGPHRARAGAGPLDGIRVIELGSAISGPLCGSLLGDLGADVVKVEKPGWGDDARRWGELVAGESPYFVQYNRDKRSICIDLQKKKGMQILERLVRGADVLVENFRPGKLAKLGLSYEKARRMNPGLIYCSVSGFGQTGPHAGSGGYDAIVQGMSGIMAVTGDETDPPMRVGVPITDIVAALYAALSVSLALFHRAKTGKGQWIDVSLLESGVSTVAQWIVISELTGRATRRFGNRYPLLAPYELFEARDRPFVLAVGNDELWSTLCRVMERPELLVDERFSTNESRIKPENRSVLSALLGGEFKKRPMAEWLQLFRKAGIPAGPINLIEDLARDEQLKARDLLVELEHASLGKVSIVSGLPKFSLTPPSIRRASPTLGQHTDEILKEVGFTKAAISGFRAAGVI